MWRSRTWSGTRSSRLIRTLVHAATSSRSPSKILSLAKRLPDALVAPCISPSSTTWRIFSTIKIQRRILSRQSNKPLPSPKNCRCSETERAIDFWCGFIDLTSYYHSIHGAFLADKGIL